MINYLHSSSNLIGHIRNISMLNAILAIIKLALHFYFHQESSSIKWEETINTIRQETNQQLILEKIVLTRLAQHKSMNSSCVSSKSLAQ